ncbi:MAG: hypothetical protein IPH54_17890 [Rhodoferax sp.]|nr:hypothetical protein [Rhodoferax sp.]
MVNALSFLGGKVHQYALHHRQILFPQAAGVVETKPYLTQSAWILGATSECRWARHVREKMVFNLVTQMAGHDVKQASALKITGAESWRKYQVTSGFVAGIFLTVNGHTFGKVPKKCRKIHKLRIRFAKNCPLVQERSQGERRKQ